MPPCVIQLFSLVYQSLHHLQLIINVLL